MAALQQQRPVPNIADIQAAVHGMTTAGDAITQGIQRYYGHQQTLNRELSRCANYDVAQIHQQLAAIPAIQSSITAIQASITAMQTSFTTMQASITAMQASITTMQTSITTMQTSITNSAALNTAQ
jgi:peptidoglycan hydrolase CwlO-like protein